MSCPNCGFEVDRETGDVYDVTFPCHRCGVGGAVVTDEEPEDDGIFFRVAGRYIILAGLFNVGDYIWAGKYKNKLCQITAFGADPKGNPTVTICPIPQGRKQEKVIGLFKIWKVRPEQITELKAKGKLV